MGRVAVFLTLVLTFHPQNAWAADDDMTFAPVPKVAGQPEDSPLSELDKSHRLGLLLDYVRKEGPGWAPGLRDYLRSPFGWIMNGFRPAASALGLDGDDDGGEGFFSSIFHPVSSLMTPPSPQATQALWFSPGYHHKGVLPFHDAMVLSLNLRERLWDNRLQFDVKPFYGQNWVSTSGYGGAEIGIGLGHSGSGQPWGRIALRYTDGDSALMDRGRGFDMHAEVQFNEHLSLHAGMHGEEDSQLGNYVLLRWKVADFGR